MMYLKGYLTSGNQKEKEIPLRDLSFKDPPLSPKNHPSGSPLKEANLIFVPQHHQNGKYIHFKKGSGLLNGTPSESTIFERQSRVQETKGEEARDNSFKRSVSVKRKSQKGGKKQSDSQTLLKTHKRYTSTERLCCLGQKLTDHSQVFVPKSAASMNMETSQGKIKKKRRNSRGRKENKENLDNKNKFVVMEQIPANLIKNESDLDYEFKLRSLEKINQCLSEKVMNMERERTFGLNNESDINYCKASGKKECFQATCCSEEVLRLSQELRKRDNEIETLLALNKNYNERLLEHEEASNKEITRLRQIINNLEGLTIEQDRKLRITVEEQEDHFRSEKERLSIQQWETVEELHAKIRSQQKELRLLAEQEGKIDALKKEIIRREAEFEELKNAFERKLERRKNTEIKQKKEWGLIYNELLGEIRSLKGDLDSLSIENRYLNINPEGSTLRSKGALSLRKDLSQEFSVESSRKRLPMRDFYY